MTFTCDLIIDARGQYLELYLVIRAPTFADAAGLAEKHVNERHSAYRVAEMNLQLTADQDDSESPEVRAPVEPRVVARKPA